LLTQRVRIGLRFRARPVCAYHDTQAHRPCHSLGIKEGIC
jgi:hypothetical protein